MAAAASSAAASRGLDPTVLNPAALEKTGKFCGSLRALPKQAYDSAKKVISAVVGAFRSAGSFICSLPTRAYNLLGLGTCCSKAQKADKAAKDALPDTAPGK